MSEDDKPRGEPAVKAKIPNAKNIKSPEFTPHGISAGRGSGLNNRPSGLTAKQAKRRRIAAIAGAVVAVVAIAGGTAYYVTRPGPAVSVTGEFGQEPEIEIPTEVAPPKTLGVTTPIVGEGRKVAKGDTAFLQFAYYKWSAKDDPENSKVKSSSEKVESTYEQGGGVTSIPVGESPVKGLDEGIVGQTVGSRVVLEVPPEKGFGEQASQAGMSPDDSLLFVADIRAAVPKDPVPQGTEKKVGDKALPSVEDKGAGKAPEVKIPDTDPPGELKAVTLVEGTGPALAKGDSAVMNYQGQLWRNGELFDSTWEKKALQAFPIGQGATIPGFDKGLSGVKVGSRVMLILPPKEGYGEQGQPQAGIKGDDTLVFVVDVLAKF